MKQGFVWMASVLGFCVTVASAQTADPAIVQKTQACAACHGADGNSTDPQYPILAGQTARYLYLQLEDFKEGRRKNAMMDTMASYLSREDMLAIAQFFSQQKPRATKFKANAEKAKLGKAKADELLCTKCHLGGFSGQNEIPRVAGQHFDYLVKQLKDFKARTRTNDAGNMTSVSNTLSDADIDNIAHYIAGLEAGPAM